MDFQFLPLQQALSYGSYAQTDKISLTVLNSRHDKDAIYVKIDLFFTSVIAGCHCADDPTPMDEYSEYAELIFTINKQTAETTIILST